MELTIKNISLFFGEDLEYIEKGYIIIKNGRIENVGSGDYKGSSNENTYEGQGILVIPGFVNAHTHIGDSIGKDIG
ncbi:MAG: cytosine deaminase, partial [Nitrososphaeraceae archaeon]|nr:cytosine deaminase [Nitrososphaeraceae archaeon]